MEGKSANFKLKSGTDLFSMAKLKTYPMTVTLSEDGEKFALYCKDKHIRVF